MYQNVGKCDFHDAFRIMGRKDDFSYEAREQLFVYLTEIEECSGEQIELDVIAICCEYAEDDVKTVLENYNLNDIEELENETNIIWHDTTNNKVLYQIY